MGVIGLKFSSLARRVQRNVEDYGWCVATGKVLAALLKLIYFHQVFRIYGIDLETAQPHTELGSYDFTFKIITAKDEPEIEQIEDLAEWLKGKLADRIASGDLCLAALDQHKVVGFNLITSGQVFIPLINIKRTFRQREAWSEHIAVQKDYRRMKLACQLRYRIFEELKKRGIRTLYGGTLSSNLASLKLTRRVGFRELVDLHYIKILNVETWRFRRVRK